MSGVELSLSLVLCLVLSRFIPPGREYEWCRALSLCSYVLFCLGLFHQAGCMRGVELSLSGFMSCFCLGL